MALLLLESEVIHPPPTRAGWAFIFANAGAFAGAIAFDMTAYRIGRDRTAFARIATARAHYGIDVFRLGELAQGHSRRIRKAVRDVLENSELDNL